MTYSKPILCSQHKPCGACPSLLLPPNVCLEKCLQSYQTRDGIIRAVSHEHIWNYFIALSFHYSLSPFFVTHPLSPVSSLSCTPISFLSLFGPSCPPQGDSETLLAENRWQVGGEPGRRHGKRYRRHRAAGCWLSCPRVPAEPWGTPVLVISTGWTDGNSVCFCGLVTSQRTELWRRWAGMRGTREGGQSTWIAQRAVLCHFCDGTCLSQWLHPRRNSVTHTT